MIALPKKIHEALVSHAKKGYPNEACGLLAGDKKTVSDFYPMKNVDNSAISYFMDPKEQLLVFKEMRQKSLEMRGVFHSHVASVAYPSQKDVRLAFYPDVSYLIVSLSNLEKPVLRSFHINEEKVTEEEVQIT